MNYVIEPNLPQSAVKIALISANEKEIEFKLKGCAVKTINITAHNLLYNAVKFHSDMQVCHLGGDKIVCTDLSAGYCKELKRLGFKLIDSRMEVTEKYPKDIPVNSAFLGKNHLICGVKHTSPVLLEHAVRHDINILNTKQGYAKCSTCVVNKNAIITSDKSIFGLAVKNGIDALLIRSGYITLDGLNYGFIGGASGMIDKNIMAFTGDISLHPDYVEIRAFLRKHSVDYVCLTDGKLRDIGGILPLICH